MRPGESFVQQPVRSLQTMLRVIAEDAGRIPTVVPDGIYGQNTMQAVSALQRQKGLPVTGVTDERTWNAIIEDYEPALIRIGKAEPIEIILDPGQVFILGDESPYLYLAQSMLIYLAKDHTSIIAPEHTGILDRPTQLAIIQFQQLNDLPDNGQLDRLTWKNLSKQFTLNAHHNTATHIYNQRQSRNF